MRPCRAAGVGAARTAMKPWGVHRWRASSVHCGAGCVTTTVASTAPSTGQLGDHASGSKRAEERTLKAHLHQEHQEHERHDPGHPLALAELEDGACGHASTLQPGPCAGGLRAGVRSPCMPSTMTQTPRRNDTRKLVPRPARATLCLLPRRHSLRPWSSTSHPTSRMMHLRRRGSSIYEDCGRDHVNGPATCGAAADQMPWNSVGRRAAAGTSSVATFHLRPTSLRAGMGPCLRRAPAHARASSARSTQSRAFPAGLWPCGPDWPF